MPVLGGVDLAAAAAWIRETVDPRGPLELVKERPWATVLRVPTVGGHAFFKACRPVQRFEPGLSADLFRRWPDRVGEVLAHDPARAWLLTADAGAPLDDPANPPERWLDVLPGYAELQRGETVHVDVHLAGDVPDLRTPTLPERFQALLAADLPVAAEDVRALGQAVPRIATLAAELAAAGIPDTIDHADLHHRSVFVGAGRVRILDWGDASIAHPFFTPFVTFRWLRDANGLAPDDPWFDRLRDAYLEPWGHGHVELFEVAQRVAAAARALAWLRHWNAMGRGAWDVFDDLFPGVLRQALTALR